METAVQISLHGMKLNDRDRDAVAAHVAELERRFGRITACHINVAEPSEHHRKGGHYQVHIRVALPNGRDINVDRNPTADERHSDLPFAINDAFHRVRRQLQDHVRQLQGQIKTNRAGPKS